MMINAGISKTEKVWMSYNTKKAEREYVITTKQDNRDCYFIYQLNGNSYEKIGKAKTPTELEIKYVKWG